MVKRFSVCLVVWLAFSVMNTVVASEYKHQVTIQGFKFVPKVLEVKQGDTIVWVNRDIVPHSIIISSSQQAVSPVLESGETFTYVVGSSLAYECGLHPPMKGKLTVLQDGM